MTPNSTPNPTLGPAETQPMDESIDLFGLALRLIGEWRLFLKTALITLILLIGLIYLIKPQFEATASILPQTKDDSGLASLFTTRVPGEVFIGLLSSRTVADEVLDATGYMQAYSLTSRAIARTQLASSSTFTPGKGQLIDIKVRDKDANLSARIANSYLDALQHQRERMLAHEAHLHDSFYEKQLASEADALARAEQELKQTQEKTGVVQPEAQTNIGLNAIADIRAQITALRVQLSALRLGETDQAPDVRALETEIGQLESHQRSLEASSGVAGAGAAASAKQMPQLNLEYTRRQREVRYHEALFTSISTQYQNARLNEGYAGAPYVVIDQAIVPERKAWPPRTMLMLLAAAFSALFAFFIIAMRIVWRRLMADPVQVERVRVLRGSFGHARP